MELTLLKMSGGVLAPSTPADAEAIKLMPIGLKLLLVLMRASPRIVSRQQLEREVWGDVLPDSDTLRSHLYALRKAIDKPFGRPLLHTVAGAGYRIALSHDEK